MALNMISTAVMVKLGKVYGNLMIDVKATNNKLRRRAERLARQLSGRSDDEVRRALEASGYRAKVAVVMLRRGCDVGTAEDLLASAGGYLRAVIDETY